MELWDSVFRKDCLSNHLGQQLKSRTCNKLDYNLDGDDPNGRGRWIVFSKCLPYGPEKAYGL
jgi:hypothetical protein